MGASEESLALLRRIAVAVEKLAAAVPSGSGAIAPDRDLDSKYGDPELRFNVRDWTGPSYKGRRFSECPPELLDMVAETLEYFARKSEETGETTSKGKPVAPYQRSDAARARGWAVRIRSGRHVQTSTNGDGWSEPDADAKWAEAPSDSDIPF